jgi:DNA mismatch repair ATPase MutL
VVTKEMLNSVEIINQVDRKFIAAKLGDILVMFDQHAVDERVKLEELEEQLANGRIQIQPTAISHLVPITPRERETLETWKSTFESWGTKKGKNSSFCFV